MMCDIDSLFVSDLFLFLWCVIQMLCLLSVGDNVFHYVLSFFYDKIWLHAKSLNPHMVDVTIESVVCTHSIDVNTLFLNQLWLQKGWVDLYVLYAVGKGITLSICRSSMYLQIVYHLQGQM